MWKFRGRCVVFKSRHCPRWDMTSGTRTCCFPPLRAKITQHFSSLGNSAHTVTTWQHYNPIHYLPTGLHSKKKKINDLHSLQSCVFITWRVSNKGNHTRCAGPWSSWRRVCYLWLRSRPTLSLLNRCFHPWSDLSWCLLQNNTPSDLRLLANFELQFLSRCSFSFLPDCTVAI